MKSDVQIMRSFARKLAASAASVSPELDALDKPVDQLPAPTAAKKPSMLDSAQKYLANADFGSMAGGMAGGIGAGLGARGLANMFRSKEDEEEGKTPWWANAAGVGAGVGGAVLGANYLPQLLSMLTAQGDKGTSYNQQAAAMGPPQITAPKNAPATSAYPRA